MESTPLSHELFENHPDPMWFYDCDTLEFLAVNEAAIKVYGYSKDEFLSMTIADIRPREDVAALRKTVSESGKGYADAGIWRHCLKSGEIIHVHITAHTVDFNGRRAELISARNVTRLVEMESRLELLLQQEKAAHRQAEQASALARVAGRAARLGGWIYDVPSNSLQWTAEAYAIHQEPEDIELSVERGIGYYDPKDQPAIERAFTRCLEQGESFDLVVQLITAKGEKVWVRSIGEAVSDSDGKIVVVQGAIQDINELIRTRMQLTETLESISDAFFTLDENWRFTFMNAKAENLLNRRRSELIGQNIWEQFPEAVGTTFQTQYERAAREQETVRFAEYFPPLETWFDVSAYPTHDGVAIYFRDVTSERQRDEQLHLLEAAVNQLNDILIITEAEPIDAPDGPKIVYVNNAFERQTGYAREEAMGKTPRILQGPLTDKRELQRIREAIAAFKPVRSELINYTKDGQELNLELDIAPIEGRDGRATHLVAIERETSERIAAEELVRVNAERFRLVAMATNDVIWDWDLQTDSVWWNDAMYSAFGYDRADLPDNSDSWTNNIHPDDQKFVIDSIHDTINGTDAYWAREYRFLRKDGVPLHVVDRGYVIRDSQGQAVRMVGSMLDVTELRELDRQLHQAQKMEVVGQLTGGIAHDFNNLLTVIMGNADSLSRNLSGQEKLRGMAELILAAAERGANLTSRLLAFARKQPLEPAAHNLNKLVSGVDDLLRRTMPEDIDVEIVRAGGLWLTEIDANQLELALLNLALNARDAMPTGGRLTIETANATLDDDYAAMHNEVVAGQYVMVSITDTGSGMNAETIEKAFEPFFTTKDVGKGSGLGLSMVYGFVKQSGGHAKIYSEVNEGTTIRLYFPRSYNASDTRAVHHSTGVGPTNGERILVVEDDELVRSYLVSQLIDLGYNVIGVSSGQAALDYLESAGAVDLLLTDVVMPGGMDGRKVADAVLHGWPQTKVLFTSGYTENAIVHNGRLDVGVQFLSKPYRREALAAKVRRVLDGD